MSTDSLTRQFKIGDRVRVVRDGNDHSFAEGTIGMVTQTDSKVSDYEPYIKEGRIEVTADDDDLDQWLLPGDVVLIVAKDEVRAAQDEHAGPQVAEFKGEPEWLKISWKYADLANATKALHADIAKYNAALNELDGTGTSITNGKDRIFLLREEIARLESASK